MHTEQQTGIGSWARTWTHTLSHGMMGTPHGILTVDETLVLWHIFKFLAFSYLQLVPSALEGLSLYVLKMSPIWQARPWLLSFPDVQTSQNGDLRLWEMSSSSVPTTCMYITDSNSGFQGISSGLGCKLNNFAQVLANFESWLIF